MMDSDEEGEKSTSYLSSSLTDHSAEVPISKCLGILFSVEPCAEVSLKGTR